MKKHNNQRSQQRRPTKPSTVYKYLPPKPPKPFWRLPPEMHLEICRHLRFYDFYAMHLTGRYFHGMLPPMPQRWELDADELEDAEASYLARDKGLAACSNCRRLRPKRLKFYSGNFEEGKTAKDRLCVACETDPMSLSWCRHCDVDSDGNEVWT